jgi:hypothetical protein
MAPVPMSARKAARARNEPRECVITPEQRAKCLKMARKGLSMVAIAHMVKRSRAWLAKCRDQDATFDADLMYQLALYEQELTDGIAKALKGRSASPELARVTLAVRTNRFPARHGNDPKLRYHHETAVEERSEDLGTAKVADGSSEVTNELLRAFLEREMNKRDGVE